MTVAFLEEPQIGETELKESVIQTLQELSIANPEMFPKDLVGELKITLSTEEFVRKVREDFPCLEPIQGFVDRREFELGLRHCALDLSAAFFMRKSIEMAVRASYSSINRKLLFVAYDAIKRIVPPDWKFEEDPEAIAKLLLNFGQSVAERVDRAKAASVARREINRVISEIPEAEEFVVLLQGFESCVYGYVMRNLNELIDLSIDKLANEAVMANMNQFIKVPAISEPDHSQYEIFRMAREQDEELNKLGRVLQMQRLGIREERGGPRNTNGQRWTDDMKERLFETRISLPKISGVSMWEYAYTELSEKDFSFRIIGYLRNETPLRYAPEAIFDKAIKTWRKFKDSLEQPKAEESHEAFALYHANAIIGGPKSKFSTLRKYYFDGQRLAKANKNGGESKK